jgi:hypothetical protein
VTAVFPTGRRRLVAIGLCYALITVIEMVYFAASMSLVRVVGLSLQAGFAAALIYGGSVRPPTPPALGARLTARRS